MNNLGNSRCVVKTGKCIKCRFSTVFFSCSLRMRCLPCAFVLGKAAFSRKRVLAKKHASFRLFWRFSTCFATFAQRAQPAQPALEEVKTPIVEDEDWSEDQEKAAGVKETLKFSVLGNENALGMVTRPSKDSPGEEPKRSEIWLWNGEKWPQSGGVCATCSSARSCFFITHALHENFLIGLPLLMCHFRIGCSVSTL